MTEKNYCLETNIKTEKDAIESDKFGHKAIVKALEETILSVQPPISIGLLGEWGVGKSFILKWLEIRLKETSSNKVKVLYYDAWKYTGESVKRSLLMCLFNQQKKTELNKHKDWLARLYNARQEPIEIKIFRPFQLTRERIIPVLTIAFILIVALGYNLSKIYNNDFTWLVAFEGLTVTTIITIAFAMFAFAIQLFTLANSATQITWKTETIPTVASAEQFENIFNEFLEELFKESKAERFVILVDELDRCDSKTRNEVLQGLKTFLKHDKCIYVVVCTPSNITTLTSTGLKTDASTTQKEELPDEEFLRKLFQINFWVDSQGEENLREYTEKLIGQMFSKKDPSLVEIIFLGNTKNPRRVKHFLNSLIFCLSVAKAREELNQIPPGVVTNNVAFLAKILLIRQDWPGEFQKIINYPYILQEWTDSAYTKNQYNELLKEDFLRFLQLTDSVVVENPTPFLAVTLGSTTVIKNRDSVLTNAMVSLKYKDAIDAASKKGFNHWHKILQSELSKCNKNYHYQWLKNGILVACYLIKNVPEEHQQQYANDISKWLKNEKVKNLLKPEESSIIFPLAVKAIPDRAMETLSHYLSKTLTETAEIDSSIGKALQDNAKNLPSEAKELLGDHILHQWEELLRQNPSAEKSGRPYTILVDIFREWPSKDVAQYLVSKKILETLLEKYTVKETGHFKHEVDDIILGFKNTWDQTIGNKFCEIFFKPLQVDIPNQPNQHLSNNQRITLSDKPLIYNVISKLENMVTKDNDCFLINKGYISSNEIISLLMKVYQYLTTPEIKIIGIALSLYSPKDTNANEDVNLPQSLNSILNYFTEKQIHQISDLSTQLQLRNYPEYAKDNLASYFINKLVKLAFTEKEHAYVVNALNILNKNQEAKEAIKEEISCLSTNDNKVNQIAQLNQILLHLASGVKRY